MRNLIAILALSASLNAPNQTPEVSAIEGRSGCFPLTSSNSCPMTRAPLQLGCGPACVWMAANQWGLQLTPQQVPSPVCKHRNGWSLDEIRRSIECLRWRASCGRFSTSKLHEHLRAEHHCAILHVNSNHFILLYGAQGARISVFDPAEGWALFSQPQFCKSYNWDGAAVLISLTQCCPAPD